MRRFWLTTATCFVVMAAATPAFAAPPTLTQSVSVDTPVEAGVPFEVSLEIEHDTGATVSVPDGFEPSRWELISSQRHAKNAGEGRATTTVVLRFGIYRPGETALAPFDISVSGAAEPLRTEPVKVKVVSALDLAAEHEFEAPRPPVEVWVDDYTLAYVGAAAGLAGLLALFGLIAHRRRALIPPPPPPPREPWEVALEKLGALAGDDLVERGEYMIFWVKMSEALREYLGRFYGFPPTELTTSEILHNLRAVRWPNGIDREDVAQFLRECDRVKFGGHRPTPDESQETLRRGFSIVELTRPRSVSQKPSQPAAAANPMRDAARTDAIEDEPRADGADRWAPPELRGAATKEEE